MPLFTKEKPQHVCDCLTSTTLEQTSPRAKHLATLKPRKHLAYATYAICV